MILVRFGPSRKSRRRAPSTQQGRPPGWRTPATQGALAAAVGTGIGLGVASLGSSSATATSLALHSLTAAADTTAAPAIPGAPASAAAPLTVDQATAVALQVSPGTVIDVKQDNETAGPTDPTDATDPTEAARPTGLKYDVTVKHQDGTTTEVVVDAATGQVVSTKVDDNPNGK